MSARVSSFLPPRKDQPLPAGELVCTIEANRLSCLRSLSSVAQRR
ncbi:hypothetical protein SAMN05421750_11327 [Agrobacterium pusense]|nr:hypothetical protein SAMN05421750_11327 [Agrobacterium pusense]